MALNTWQWKQKVSLSTAYTNRQTQFSLSPWMIQWVGTRCTSVISTVIAPSGDTKGKMRKAVYSWNSQSNRSLLWFITQSLHSPLIVVGGDRATTSDLIFVDEQLNDMSRKSVLQTFPGSQHRPVKLKLQPAVEARETPFLRRYNFRKSNWDSSSCELDQLPSFEATVENNDQFIQSVRKASNKPIPRGRTTRHQEWLKRLRLFQE